MAVEGWAQQAGSSGFQAKRQGLEIHIEKSSACRWGPSQEEWGEGQEQNLANAVGP